MSLPGLLRVIADDPQLSRALEQAAEPASPGADLIAPPALRPFLAAALAGAGGIRRPVRARRDRHRPGGRGADRGARLAAAGRRGRLLPGLGDAAARAAVARARTPRASGWRCCAGWPTPTRPTPGPGPLTVRGHPGALPAPADGRAGSATLEPVRLRAGRDGRPRRPGDRGWWTSGTRGPTWSSKRGDDRGARRHPGRVPADRGAPAAGRVLRRHASRRSATSGSPTSAAWARPPTACGRRRAGSCC